jgi:large subunit ribosomal protein L10
MPLLRSQKETLVENVLNDLNKSRVSLVVSYSKLTMPANDTLRDKAFEQHAKIKMISNTLLALMLKKLGRTLEIPQKQLALAYGFDDEVGAAKLLVEFAKETEALEIIGGWVDGKFFDASQVKTLATLPSREQLQAQVIGRLYGMLQGLAYNVNYPLQKLAYVVKAIEESKK